jgi:hypothetical protein
MNNIFEMQPGDVDYLLGVWAIITDDGMLDEKYATKFDALMAGLNAHLPNGFSVAWLSLTDMDSRD